MKYLFGLMLFLVACRNDDAPAEETEEMEVLTAEEVYAYTVDADSQKVVRNAALPENYLQEDSLIKGLNQQYPDVVLVKVKKSNDTLYTRIPNAEHLTQQMGSAGPEQYFANLYFNLTAVPGIRYVRVDFEEGDHAQPGVFGPENFKEYKIDSTKH